MKKAYAPHKGWFLGNKIKRKHQKKGEILIKLDEQMECICNKFVGDIHLLYYTYTQCAKLSRRCTNLRVKLSQMLLSSSRKA